MILGIEIALIIAAIYGLIRGRLPITKTRVVQGTPARLLALLGFVPIPLTFLIAVVVLGAKAAQGGQIDEKSAATTGMIIEVGVVLGTLVVFFVTGFALATDPSRQSSEVGDDRPRRRSRDDEDEDRPRRRRRDDEEDRDDDHIQSEDRPRRRPHDDEDDERIKAND
jgi:hypothetical protein